MGSGTVLVVDDDTQIMRALTTSLKARRYEVRSASNGETALSFLAEETFDLVVLDLGLPGIDGVDVIRRAREWTDVPIIVLTVQDSQEQKVTALDAGADDYVTKPFAMEELLARMRAVTRRAASEPPRAVHRFGDLEVDLEREAVKLNGELLHLTPTEYRLLEAMATRPGKLLTHAWLLQKAWGPGYAAESHYLRVYIRQLRRKLNDDPVRPRYIVTESGLGYRWKPEPDSPNDGS